MRARAFVYVCVKFFAITESAFQETFQKGRNVGNGVSPVEGTTLKGKVLKML
jgi:hypothetical protein